MARPSPPDPLSLVGRGGEVGPGRGVVGGVVLASGLSRRFGGRNKLLLPLGGAPIVRRTVQAYLDAGLDPVLVVVGHEAERVSEALEGLPLRVVRNPEYAEGQSTSLARGVRALPADVEAAVIGVGDQPLLTGEVVKALVERYRSGRPALVVPRYGGGRGNPVLFSRALFAELLEVRGDQGGRAVIGRHGEDIVWLDVPDARAAADVDTEEEYARLVSQVDRGM